MCPRHAGLSDGAAGPLQGGGATYAWIARKDLTTRPFWKQVGEYTFAFQRSGESISIGNDLSLADVIHMVIDVEMRHNVKEQPPWRQEELLSLAHYEAEEYLQTGRAAEESARRPLQESNQAPTLVEPELAGLRWGMSRAEFQRAYARKVHEAQPDKWSTS